MPKRCKHYELGVVWRNAKNECIPCRREYMRDYMESRRRRMPEVREADRDRMRRAYRLPGGAAKTRARDLKRHYGMTPEDVQQMIEQQLGLCAWCKEPFGEEHSLTPVVDHDKRLGNRREAVRSILHQECNRQFGYLELWRERLSEVPEYADRAIKRVSAKSV